MLWFWHLIWSSSFAAIVAGEWMVMPTLESTFCPQGGHKCWLREWPRKSVELTLNSSCSLFLKKSMGFGGHVGSAWGENEELPAIDLRRISWPCQLMTSGDESRNTHPWVTLKKKRSSSQCMLRCSSQTPNRKLLDIVAFEKARPLLLETWGFGDASRLDTAHRILHIETRLWYKETYIEYST